MTVSQESQGENTSGQGAGVPQLAVLLKLDHAWETGRELVKMQSLLGSIREGPEILHL